MYYTAGGCVTRRRRAMLSGMDAEYLPSLTAAVNDVLRWRRLLARAIEFRDYAAARMREPRPARGDHAARETRESMRRWHAVSAKRAEDAARELARAEETLRRIAPSSRALSRPPSSRAGRPQCAARCRDGHACRAPCAVGADGRVRSRCRMHGGASTGPRTPEGRARAMEALARATAARRARSMAARAAAAA